MKFKIHYEIKDFEDFYILMGDTIEDIIRQNNIEMAKRGLDADKNNCWSEEIIRV